MTEPYYSFNKYLREKFGVRVHRISIDAGFGCPNRDGTISRDGCIFCNEAGFSRAFGSGLSVERQIEDGMKNLRARFKADKFIAYFQSGTNTFADAGELKEKFDAVKRFPDVVGLYLSTRPDVIDGEKLRLIDSYADRYDVWIEYGLQSAHDPTLKLINRGHDFRRFAAAVSMTAEYRIKIGAHIIIGLPGENRSMLLETADAIAGLPVSGIKPHVLHVLKGTKLEGMHRKGELKILAQAEYVSLLCDLLERINPQCVIFRLVSDAYEEFLIAPLWINKKAEVLEDVNKEFKRRGTSQGTDFGKKN